MMFYKKIWIYTRLRDSKHLFDEWWKIKRLYFYKDIPEDIKKNGVIFIHIPRTAGSSIVQAGFPEIYGHVNYRWYQTRNPALYAQMFKFAFVRNPWDRVYSTFAYLRSNGLNPLDKRFAKKYVLPASSFEDFVNRYLPMDQVRSYLHFIPQVDFICDSKLNVQIDFVGRFENLPDDIAHLEKMLDKKIYLKSTNASVRLPYADVYNNRMKDIVAQYYSKDIEIFSYTF